MSRRRYPKPAREMILELLRELKRPIKLSEIVEKTDIKYNTVRGRLYELKREGFVRYTSDGWVCSE